MFGSARKPIGVYWLSVGNFGGGVVKYGICMKLLVNVAFWKECSKVLKEAEL